MNEQNMRLSIRRVFRTGKRTVSGRKKLSAAVLFILGLTLPFVYVYGRLSREVRIREENRYTIVKESLAGREEIPLEEYLVGAMALCLPEDVGPEVCKAQAVILRTHVEKLAKESGSIILPYEVLCQESLTGMTLYGEYGGENTERLAMLEEAVQETKGEVMVYEGAAVELPFFPVSSGRTRAGEEVFKKGSYPYLESVACEEDEFAEGYSQEILINKNIWQNLLAQIFVTEETIMLKDIRLERDSAGYVTEIAWRDTHIPGELFRERLELPSACFEIEERENQIVIVTKGIGHGLGMSLYAAGKMAENGEDYREILRYFFPRCEIVKN